LHLLGLSGSLLLQHYWIIGDVDHSSDADLAAASAPDGALYMAHAGSPPSDLPPVNGWTEGAGYAAARRGVESAFHFYLQAFVCVLLLLFGLCHLVVQRRTAAQELAQQERRAVLVQMGELRRTGRLAVRERELAESSAELEAWEASWLYPWKMGDDVAHLPRLVQVQQPGDALYELGVVVVEGRDSAGAPAAPGCVAADPRRADEKQRSGQRDAGSVSSGGAALEDAMDNPLHETSPADGDDLNSIETV
jgi:hypothetical protein